MLATTYNDSYWHLNPSHIPNAVLDNLSISEQEQQWRALINIFDSHKLDENSVCSILERTADDGKRYKM